MVGQKVTYNRGEHGLLAISRMLKEKNLLGVVYDQDTNDDGVEIELFGKHSVIPLGPAALSRIYGSPILPIFLHNNDDWTCTAKIYPALYTPKTKDKKPHSLEYFWVTSIIKDIITKGCTVTISTTGLIYIVIVGSNDWNLMLLALVNLILFICFGLIALNKGYDYYNNTYVNYMKEKIDEANKKAMDEGKELLETDLERVKRLEDVNPLHHSEHSSEL